ncbi:MAG: hypothetical protein IKN74_01075 [Clostridia bacterium]|nr:hypothetical protein [Bacilli bacterium]MBR3511535.1 hypothetical protein [Clostridia bacterium]
MSELNTDTLTKSQISPIIIMFFAILLVLVAIKTKKHRRGNIIFIFTMALIIVGHAVVPPMYAPVIIPIAIFFSTMIIFALIIKDYYSAKKDIGKIKDEMSVKIKAKLIDEKRAGISHEICPQCKEGELVTYGNGPVLGVFCSNFPKCMYFDEIDASENEIKQNNINVQETTNGDGIEEKYKNDDDEDPIKNI